MQTVALCGIDLWWDSTDLGKRDDLQLPFNRQGTLNLGTLPTTQWGALMRKSGIIPTPVTSDSRQQRFTARLVKACSSKLTELHKDPFSGAPICQVVMNEHEHGCKTKRTNWLATGKEPVVRTMILDNTTAARSTAQPCAGEKEANIGAGVWKGWTYESR